MSDADSNYREHARAGPRPAAVSRRSLLLAGGAAVTATAVAALLSGCISHVTNTTAPPAPMEPLTPILRSQQHLLATYEQTLSAFPELHPNLADLQAQSSAHTRALSDAAPAAAAQVAASSDSTGSPRQSSVPPSSPHPADAASAQSALAQVVDTAAGTLRAGALRADGELAALLGSCAASTACHARLLGL